MSHITAQQPALARQRYRRAVAVAAAAADSERTSTLPNAIVFDQPGPPDVLQWRAVNPLRPSRTKSSSR